MKIKKNCLSLLACYLILNVSMGDLIVRAEEIQLKPDSATIRNRNEPLGVEIWKDPITHIEFMWIPGGCFQMGQSEAEKDVLIKEWGKDEYDKIFSPELPQHQVCVNGFWMGKYEVTQAQWQEIMGNNPEYFNHVKVDKETENYPVEMRLDDTQAFIKQLNTKSGNIFRLPTEAEWEYACRAGTETAYNFGDDIGQLSEYAWYAQNSGNHAHPVGQKKPNVWGLYDMPGNIWEWCVDTYHDSYQGAPTDGNAWVDYDEEAKVARGGSFYDHHLMVRCAFRWEGYPVVRYFNVGLRLVRSASGQ